MSRNAVFKAVPAVLPSNESPPLSRNVCYTHGVTHATHYTSIAWKSVIIVMITLLVYGLSGIASPSAHATDPDARPHVPENWQWGSGTVDMVLQNRHSLPHVDDDTCRPSERLNRPGFVRGSQVPRRRVPVRGCCDGRCPRARRAGSCRSRRADAGG